MSRVAVLGLALSASAVLGFAACGGDDEPGRLPGTGAASSGSTTSSGSGTGAAGGAGGEGPGGAGGAGGEGGASLCGNGVIDPGEDCEGTDLGGKSCQDLGYSNPDGLACTDTCHFAFVDCAPTCDGQLKEPGEECDGETVSLETCVDFGYSTPGMLTCGPSCTYDTSGCEATCDGVIVEPGEACDGSAPPGQVCLADCTIDYTLVINEVFYDRTGTDTGCFVELRGEPGLDLAGYSLHFVDGATGAAYAPALDLAGTIGASGYFVVAQDVSVGIPVDANSVVDARADLSDGPDSLVLTFGADTVDAVGYGTFAAGDTFAGEGQAEPGVVPPADPAAPQVALARVPDGTDTEVNSADFQAQTPTPGAAN